MISEEVLKGMFRPITNPWRTAITKVEPNRLITRGYQQEDLIGNISFPEMIYLLINGLLPTKNQERMLQTVLVSFCDHGVTPPSTQSARIMASAGSSVNACLAGGILAFGENHAGAIETSMKMLQEGIKITKTHEFSIRDTAERLINHFSNNGKKIPGFGHRYHKEDPRAARLLELSKEYGCFGEHNELAIEIQNLLYESKAIKMNIDGANAAILSDIGFNWKVGCGIFIIGRMPGLLAHVNEEKINEQPFRKLVETDELYPPKEETNLFGKSI
jgi:citrate synthase